MKLWLALSPSFAIPIAALYLCVCLRAGVGGQTGKSGSRGERLGQRQLVRLCVRDRDRLLGGWRLYARLCVRRSRWRPFTCDQYNGLQRTVSGPTVYR